jgi:hypothetical protein
VLAALDPASKVDPDWPRLVQLRDLGRSAAEAWLYKGAAPGASASRDFLRPQLADRA